MFLHIGADVVVSLKKVIAIMDLRTAEKAVATQDFLSLSRTEKRVIDIADGDAKSLIVTDHEVYLSPISSMTLKKRADFLAEQVLTDLST